METFTIRDLTFSYPEQEKKVLDQFCLTVEQGEFLVLCGPSGCGKSTLLRHLKPETDPETDCPEAFILAAGWLILDRMEVQTEAAVPLSFTAGSVTISGTDSGRRTRAAFDLLSPWCRDDRFAVREVMG
jgi:energy-coupling factor transporter ATP-binding protein EcfA2